MSALLQFTDGDYTVAEQVDGKRLDFPFTDGPSPDRYAKATERDIECATTAYVPRVATLASFTNLLLRSEQIDNASWTKTNTTVTADATTAPDGQATMDFVKETATTAAHSVSQAGTVAASAANLSVFAQAAGRNYLKLLFTDSAATAFSAFFDLALGRVFSSGTGATAAIQPMGDNSYRCSISFTPAAGAGTALASISTDGSTTSYAGNTSLGLYLWGFDLKNAASVGPYISTTTVSRTVICPDVDVDDPLQYLLTESKPRAIEANILQVTRGFARIPAAQITYGNNAFTRPVMDDILSGTTYAATLDKGVSSTIWTTRKAITVIGPVVLATQTTTNNASVPGSINTGSCSVSVTTGVGTSTFTCNSSPGAIYGVLNAIGTGATCVKSDTLLTFSVNGIQAVSVSSGFKITGSGSTYSVTCPTPTSQASSVIAPGVNQSYRQFTIPSHGMSDGQLVALWFADRVVARSHIIGIPGVSDPNNICLPLADVDGANFTASFAATSPQGTRYINGVKYCSTKLTQGFYLPGVSVGITTPADIPQPDVIMSAQGWLDIIVAGTPYGTIQVSELASWRGSIYAQTQMDIQMSDALETM